MKRQFSRSFYYFRHSFQNERGVSAIVVAASLVVLVGFSVMAIDVGHALVTRTQLQNAADSAALGAGGALGRVYLALPKADQSDMNRNLTSNETSQIQTAGMNAGFANAASDVQNLNVGQGEIELGTWDMNTRIFTPTITRPTAVRVTVRRDGTQNGPIATFFAGIFGINTMSVNAQAIAALASAGGPSNPGAGNAPFGISQDYFNVYNQCGDIITFSPTGTQQGCAGWHTFDELGGQGNKPKNCNGGTQGQGGANTTLLRNIIDCLEADTYSHPPIEPGVTQFEFTGGQVSTAFKDLEDLYNSHKDSNNEWHISVPVYQGGGNCANPSGPITIVGYANVTVTQVTPPQGQGQAYIEGQIECNTFIDAAPSPNPAGGGVGTSPISPYPILVS